MFSGLSYSRGVRHYTGKCTGDVKDRVKSWLVDKTCQTWQRHGGKGCNRKILKPKFFKFKKKPSSSVKSFFHCQDSYSIAILKNNLSITLASEFYCLIFLWFESIIVRSGHKLQKVNASLKLFKEVKQKVKTIGFE